MGDDSCSRIQFFSQNSMPEQGRARQSKAEPEQSRTYLRYDKSGSSQTVSHHYYYYCNNWHRSVSRHNREVSKLNKGEANGPPTSLPREASSEEEIKSITYVPLFLRLMIWSDPMIWLTPQA